METNEVKTTITGYIMTLPMYINTISFSIMFILMQFITGFGQSQLTIYIIWLLTVIWAAVGLKILRFLGMLNNDQMYGWNFVFALLSQTATNLFIFLAVSMSISLIGSNSGLHPFDKMFLMFIYIFSILLFLGACIMDANALERIYDNAHIYLKIVPS